MAIKAQEGGIRPTGAQRGALPWTARVYLAAMVSLCILCFVDAAGDAGPVNYARFILYLAISVAASVLKVSLPGIRGTMSVNFFFFLVSVVTLTVTETLVIGVASAAAQTFWRPKSKPNLARAAFNIALIAVALRVTYSAFHVTQFAGLAVQFHLRLLLTAAVYFVMNTLPVAIMIRLTEGRPLVKTWRETYFWVFSYYLVGAAFAAIFNALERSMGWEASVMVLPVLYAIYRAYRLYLNQVEEEKAQAEFERAQAEAQRVHAEEVSALHLRTIEALAMAIEAKDQTTHDHLQRVQVYCVELGKLLGLSAEDMQALRAAALLHDIGKLAVPEHIISKPGRLTREEFEKMKIHPVVGAEILEHVQFPYPVVPIVRHHHERWDGTGYPDSLKEEEIPIGARILAAVDCLDALASDRQYRKAISLDHAVDELVKMAGRSYDPLVVGLLRAHYREWERMANAASAGRTKSTGELRVERGTVPPGRTPSRLDRNPERKEGTQFLSSIGAARHEAQVLFELTQDMGSSLALDEMLSVVALRLKKLIPYDTFAVYLKQHMCLQSAFVIGDDFRLFSSLRVPVGQGLCGWVVEHQKAIVNGNPTVEFGYLEDPTMFSTLRSALCIPLDDGDSMAGVLSLYAGGKDAFTQDHLRILLMIAPKLSQSIQNSLQYRRAEDTSQTDYLTGLPNARSLFGYLDEALKNTSMLSVLVCDLDGFKQVNDRFGHMEGDRLLKDVAVALKRACKESDYVARMGGDEFVIVLQGLDVTRHPERLSQIVRAVEEVGLQKYGEPIVSLSVGVALAPEDGFEQESIIAAADKRMYKVKAQRKVDRTRAGELMRVASVLDATPQQDVEAVPQPARKRRRIQPEADWRSNIAFGAAGLPQARTVATETRNPQNWRDEDVSES